ncbi:MAG: threo-3-hydroxy-L-aspartate ammonia-lyase [Acidobacteriota bacterium]
MSNNQEITFAEVESAACNLHDHAHRTPVVQSTQLDRLTDARVFLKAENFQRTGSFKFRGAYNALSLHRERSPERGILAYSSGNHAQAVALASTLLDVESTIVMPSDAPEVKLRATRGYGGNVVLYDREETTREELGAQIAEEKGLDIIPAYDHPWVIAGQGTATMELIEDAGPFDVLLVCCGGGGLLSGAALAARHLNPSCQIIGVEPELADDAARSFRTGTLQSVHNPKTVADGARTPSLGNHTFPLVMALVDDIVTVSEEAILSSMAFAWERLKVVLEPTGALALAGLMSGAVNVRSGQRVGVTLSGGNVDLHKAAELLAGAKTPD